MRAAKGRRRHYRSGFAIERISASHMANTRPSARREDVRRPVSRRSLFRLKLGSAVTGGPIVGATLQLADLSVLRSAGDAGDTSNKRSGHNERRWCGHVG